MAVDGEEMGFILSNCKFREPLITPWWTGKRSYIRRSYPFQDNNYDQKVSDWATEQKVPPARVKKEQGHNHSCMNRLDSF